LFERFGDSAYVLGRASLLPERGTTLDLGLRVDWPELRAGEYFYAELLGFASWVEDLIHYAQNSQGIARPDNTEAARSAGVELALSGDVWRHLRLHGHLTWMHTENRGTIVARRGKSLPFRPTLRVFLRVEAYGDIGQGQQLGATLDATYASGHALDHSNLVTVDERLILGAGAWFEALESQLRVALNVRNLTDAHLVDFSGYPMPGLTAMVSVTGRPALD
jgi:outer membrane receptor protein involved in Fe transport